MTDKNIMSLFQKKITKIVIVMDEIDGMNNGDKGGINTLIKLIRPKKTKKQKQEEITINPIICIGNYYMDKKIKELIKNKQITENDIRFFIGYAGWQPKQLERELSENSWLVLKASADEILKANSEQVWRKILISLGEEYAPWVNYPDDPQMN